MSDFSNKPLITHGIIGTFCRNAVQLGVIQFRYGSLTGEAAGKRCDDDLATSFCVEFEKHGWESGVIGR